MAVEQAIVSLVVQGAEQVSLEADRIVVNLSSVERAGARAEEASKSAENAAKEAERASRELTREVTGTLRTLARAARLAKKVASAAGYDKDSQLSNAIDIIGGGLSGAAQGARLGSTFGPWGTAIGAVGGGLLGEYTTYSKIKARNAARRKKLEERERKRLAKERDERLVEELLKQVGLYKLDSHTYGPRQVP